MADGFYFYPSSMGICGGSWRSTPRNAMFPGIGISSSWSVDVSDFYMPGCYDYIGNDKPGSPAWDYNFPVMSEGNGFSPSTLSNLKQTLFSDGDEVVEISSCDDSIPNQFSRDDSSALVKNFLFGASDPYSGSGEGIPANNCNDRNPPASAKDQFSNLKQLSAPSLPKLRLNSKPSSVNKTRPSAKTTTTKLEALNTRGLKVHFLAQQRPCSKLPSDVGGIKRDVNTSTKRSTNMGESGLKRTRIETPSPLPTFKVRKEKLGDRITALQQLVSPFGKTDTASVLHEAIDHIKFLHDQVHVLSAPYMKYMKNGPAKGLSEVDRGLRSQGLCLVPIWSTFPFASETPIDFCVPTTLGGANFRY